MDRIKNYSNAKITIPNIGLIEFKEALIFAFLGVLRLRGEINVLASVTGAKSNHSSGKIFISSDR
jgi:anhydro-N-acetylmuramic acid kinase